MSLPLLSPRSRRRAVLVAAGLLGSLGALEAVVSAIFPACQTYQAPPTASIEGLTNGILPNPLTPIVLQFSTPVDPATVSVEIAPFDIDAYGNLPDEEPDAGPLGVLASHTPTADSHVHASFSADQTTLTLTVTPDGWLPIGPSLVLLVLPGVTSTTTGTVLHYRQRIPFSYPVACGGVHATSFRSGAYFFLLQINKPLGDELKAFAAIDVNSASGAFYGQFTAALRNSDPSRCHPPCTGGLVCQLLPSEMCVEMSAPPVNVYESPDYVPKATAPNGYTFEMHGCAVDEGDAGAVNILTAPGVLNVTSPNVSIQGLTFTAQFVPVDGGLVMASGSLTATKTFLGSIDLGPGAGTLTALSIPDAEVPANLPQPGALTDAGDAGEADAGGDGGGDASADDAGP